MTVLLYPVGSYRQPPVSGDTIKFRLMARRSERTNRVFEVDKAGRRLPTAKGFKVAGPVYTDRLDRYIKSIKLDSVQAIREQFDKLSGPCWVFRGQSNSRWHLTTSLERVATWRDLNLNHAESRLITDFKSRAHLYTKEVPPMNDDLEWVALMQHHGCPTRLLDFTRSPYVALCFAVDQVASNRECAVWAINSQACDERAIHRIEIMQEWGGGQVLDQEDFFDRTIAGRLSTAELFGKVFLGNRFSLVCTVQPVRHNDRMVSQKGCFLCPGDISGGGFEDNLFTQLTAGKDPEYFLPVWNPPQIFRLRVPGRLRCETVRELARMNISRSSLFPSLDGLAGSLRLDLECDPENER